MLSSQRFSSLLLLELFSSLFLTPVAGHSWIDGFWKSKPNQANEIILGANNLASQSNALGSADGYARFYPFRSNPEINTIYTCEIGTASADVCCKDKTLPDAYSQLPGSKMLVTQANEVIHFAYMPNGHITKDQKGRGTKMHVYWTGKRNTDFGTYAQLDKSLTLTPGGLDFDDGKCGETCAAGDDCLPGRLGDYQPCWGKFTVPKDITSGVYSLVWMWDFDAINPGAMGPIYTSCFEIGIGNFTVSAASQSEDSVESLSLFRIVIIGSIVILLIAVLFLALPKRRSSSLNEVKTPVLG